MSMKYQKKQSVIILTTITNLMIYCKYRKVKRYALSGCRKMISLYAWRLGGLFCGTELTELTLIAAESQRSLYEIDF